MESFLEDLKLQVQCSLCKETMVEPKLLQCFHTFCKTCIERNTSCLKQIHGSVDIFECPQCDSSTKLQELNDVEDLEISPIHSRILQVLSFVENQKVCSVSASHSEALWQCLDCDRSLCDECLGSHSIFTKDHKVLSLSEMTKEDIEGMLKKESPCQVHASHEIESYCRDCDKPICLLCLKDYHKNHKITSPHEFLAEKKDSLSKSLEEIESLQEDEEKKKQQEQIAVGIKRDGKQAQAKVKELTKDLVKAVIDQEQKLLNEIKKKTTKADWNLRIIHHAPAAQEYIKYLIQNGTVSDMVDIHSQAECSKTFTYNAFEKHIAGMEFKPNEKLYEQVNTGLGLLRGTFIKPDPKMSVFQVKPNELVVKKNATLTVILNQGEPCDSSLDDVTIRFTPTISVGEKRATADGQIKVTFTPSVSGQLTAEVKVHGNPVSNSPLVMDVKPQQIQETPIHSKLKIALNTISSRQLSGIAVNRANSKIAVADCGLHCVKVFNMDGGLLLSYGIEGSGNRELRSPQGLAFLNETDLVIADSGNQRICIVDTASDRLLKCFFLVNTNNKGKYYPRGVYVDDDYNIIVCDYSSTVRVFTRNGGRISQFSLIPAYGAAFALSHNGLLYVSAASSVHVIRIKGNDSPTTVDTIGDEDHTDGRLHDPTGLAIDNDNNLLVCDSKSCKVHKFTLDGRYVGGTSWLNFMKPQYMAVLNDGQIICTSAGVRVFFF